MNYFGGKISLFALILSVVIINERVTISNKKVIKLVIVEIRTSAIGTAQRICVFLIEISKVLF